MSVATPPRRGRQRPWPRLLAALALAALAGGCASLGTGRAPEPELAYVVDGADRIARHAPVFVHEHDTEAYNRIGRPRAARDAHGGERVFVDPAEPVVFVEQRSFTSTGGVRYTNLFYRVHFERVPVSLAPFHVTAGRNGGLFVIATLDADEQPVLYTTVHTCGCYLAFLPTNLLPATAYPEDWPENGQWVFGERLPSRVAFADPRTADQGLVVRLRDGTHRIMDA